MPIATTTRSLAPDLLATVARSPAVAATAPALGRIGAVAPPEARAASVPSAPGRRGEPVARPRAHFGPAGGGRVLRTVRRERVPWTGLSRRRLAAAWGRVQIEHASAGELLLVGVFGPVPIDAITAVALEPDGRLAMTFSRSTSARRGDVALARHAATGRLLRSDIPHLMGG